MSIGSVIQDLIKRLKGEAEQPPIEIDKAALSAKLKESEFFGGLTDDAIATMLGAMERVDMKVGDIVVQEGEEGDYYYLLAAGTAVVTKRKGAQDEVVAELSDVTGFGEEALISMAKRNASITMKTAGVVLRLSKDGFNDHVKEPAITWISPAAAQKQIAIGAKWLDVRDDDGTGISRLRNAVAIPMGELRDSLSKLEQGTAYICYCENGRLSSTAAFLIGLRGYDITVMRGGLQGLKRAGLL